MRFASRFLTFAGLVVAALALLVVSALPAQATPIAPAYCSPCLFYGGDNNPGDANSNGLFNGANSSGTNATVYTPFVVPVGQTWDVTGLFSNNMMNITALSANWSIQSGMSVGNGGTTLYSGTSGSPAVTDTGINNFGYEIYSVAVTGLTGIQLGAGTYWLSVVPLCTDGGNSSCSGNSYLANTNGANGYGPAEPANMSLFNSTYFGYNYSNAGGHFGPGQYTTFSAGVIGTLASAVPEPAELGMFGLGMLLLGGFMLRRRRFA